MRLSMDTQAQIKVLCGRMVARCDEYVELKSIPERESEADEVKEEIKRLYVQISAWSSRN